MARYNAIPSFPHAVSYGWNYPGVNKRNAVLQGIGVVGVPFGVGYGLGEILFE